MSRYISVCQAAFLSWRHFARGLEFLEYCLADPAILEWPAGQVWNLPIGAMQIGAVTTRAIRTVRHALPRLACSSVNTPWEVVDLAKDPLVAISNRKQAVGMRALIFWPRVSLSVSCCCVIACRRVRSAERRRPATAAALRRAARPSFPPPRPRSISPAVPCRTDAERVLLDPPLAGPLAAHRAARQAAVALVESAPVDLVGHLHPGELGADLRTGELAQAFLGAQA